MPRCKVGDLAVIVRSDCLATEPNVGALVEVLERWPLCYGWWVVRSLGRPLLGFDIGSSRIAIDDRPLVIPDAWLRPLRDGSPENHMLTIEDLDSVVGGVVDWGDEARLAAGGRA